MDLSMGQGTASKSAKVTAAEDTAWEAGKSGTLFPKPCHLSNPTG